MKFGNNLETLEPGKGPAIVLTLEGEAQDTVLEIYKKDELIQKYTWLVYTLLEAANLATQDEELVKATITELKYVCS